MDEEDRKKFYLRDFNNLNWMLLGVTAVLGCICLISKMLGYPLMN